ncbi:MAG: hypothetical protein HYY06_13135 [Deltaproteobacteria bacterium]|nr:hypothetical protein [Deltaproteobacteria bacterium]
MFDVLGFKQLRALRGTSGLHRLYMRAIVPSVQHAAVSRRKTVTVDGQPCLVPDETSWRVALRVFSDTVVYMTADDGLDSFLAVTEASFELLRAGFCGFRAPFRGAIGHGDLIDEPAHVLIGSAVEDAHSGEQSQAWAGCCLTPNCQAFVQDAGHLTAWDEVMAKAAEGADEVNGKKRWLDRRLLVEYEIPTQHKPNDGPIRYGTRRGLAVDWTFNMYEGAAQKSFHPSDDRRAMVKANNTRTLEAWARAKNG